MKLEELILILEDCHGKLYYFCEDDENGNIPWYAGAQRELKRTIEFMKDQRRHLTNR